MASTQRRRGAATGSLHSRRVRALRVVFPIAAIAGFLALIVIWQTNAPPGQRLMPGIAPAPAPEGTDGTAAGTGLPAEAAATGASTPPPSMELLETRFAGRDQQGRPYAVTARRAVQATGATGFVDLADPQAEMTLEAGARLDARAASGRYYERAGELVLRGGVAVAHSEGMEIHTEALAVDVNALQATTDHNVRAFGPAFDLEAAGMSVIDAGNRVVFWGPARLIVSMPGQPAAAEAETAP